MTQNLIKGIFLTDGEEWLNPEFTSTQTNKHAISNACRKPITFVP
jgi:hypothetical protein